jgi:hypothetical protein
MKKTTDIIRKPRSLIEIEEKTPLSLMARRMFTHLLNHAFQNGWEKETHSIPLQELRGKHDVNNRAKAAAKELVDSTVTFDLLGTSGQDWAHSSLVSEVYYHAGSGILEFTLPRQTRLALADETRFAALSLKVCYSFKSKYSLVLYELISARYKLKFLTSEVFEIVVLRELLGVPIGKYKNASELRTWVFKRAVDEVNKFSPFSCSIEVEKTRGRKITHFRVSWSQKTADEGAATKANQANDLPLFQFDPITVELVDKWQSKTEKRRIELFTLASIQNNKNGNTEFDRHDINNPRKWIELVADELET